MLLSPCDIKHRITSMRHKIKDQDTYRSLHLAYLILPRVINNMFRILKCHLHNCYALKRAPYCFVGPAAGSLGQQQL